MTNPKDHNSGVNWLFIAIAGLVASAVLHYEVKTNRLSLNLISHGVHHPATHTLGAANYVANNVLAHQLASSGSVIGNTPHSSVQLASVPVNKQEFRNFLDDNLKHIPLTKSLRNIQSADVHFTPEILRNYGTYLGTLVEVLKQHPEWSEDISKFYRSCALTEGTFLSVRALCYSHLKTLEPSLKKEEFPERVIVLGDEV